MVIHLKRLLQQQAWESAIHAQKFQRLWNKLVFEQARRMPEGERGLPLIFYRDAEVRACNKIH